MAQIKFNHSNAEGQQTISVFLVKDDGTQVQKIVTPANPSFQRLATYLVTTPEAEMDAERVHGMVDPAIGIGVALRDEFGDRVTFDSRAFRVDGIEAEGFLNSHVRDMALAGDDDWQRFARFLVNVESNPSFRARTAVYQWVEANGLTITEDGRFLGYKGVSQDGESISSGPNNFIDGVLYKDGATTVVPYVPGTVVSKRRGDVDDRPMACSYGLHVGTEDYAKGWGPRTMVVAINPADVVSVPDNNLSWKIRVCALEVISESDDSMFRVASDQVSSLSEPQRVLYNRLRGQDHTHEEALAEAQEYVEPEPEPVVEVAVDPTEIVSIPKDDEGVGEVPNDVDLEPGMLEGSTLEEYATQVESLRRDLEDKSLGHKPLARKWSNLTTEASVRRYRKAHGITLNLGTRISDAIS